MDSVTLTITGDFPRKLLHLKPSILHIQWSRVPIIDLWLVRQIQRSSIPIVHTIHDIEPLFEWGGSHRQLQQVYAAVDALIVHTDGLWEDLLVQYPDIDPRRVHVIPHITLPNTQVPVQATRSSARQMLNLPEQATIVAFIGSIKAYKGLDILALSF